MTGCTTGFRPPEGLVFGFHPSSRGFGWVAFEGPAQPFDWGLAAADSDDKNRVCLRRLAQLLDRLQPHVMAMEVYQRGVTRRAARIVRLCEAAEEVAADRGIEVVLYTRDEIRETFGGGVRTRRQIAEAVARHIEAFSHRLPPHRRLPWETEDTRNALFSAAAVALAHFRDGEGDRTDFEAAS